MRPKYEREIDEILSQFDDGTPTRVATPIPMLEEPTRLKPRPRFTWQPMVSVSASSLMIAALALAVLGYPLQWIPVLSPAVGPIGIMAAVLLIASLVLSVTRSRRSGSNARPMWRGQPMNTPKDPFGTDDIRRRWRRWRAHQRFRQPPWN